MRDLADARRIVWKSLQRYVPAVHSLRSYSWRSLGGDLTAGLTVATVAVPQAMAYATLAGLPPQYGLFTAIVMTAVGALLDSSRQLINGPTNAISIALLSGLAVIPEGERISAAVLLAFLVGGVQLGIALLRLGDLTRYVSHSVIVGFTVGASTLLVLDQMKNLFGWEARGDPESHFLRRFWLSLTAGGGIHWPTFLTGACTIAVVLAVRKFNEIRRNRGARFPIPQHLVAITIMAFLVWALGLNSVKVVGPVPASLPSFQPPELKWDQVRLLSGNAFAIAVLGLLEAVAMAKAIAKRTGQRLDINQQCLSEGAANLAGSFFQCIPGSGSLTRSAVNQQAGAVSQWSGVFAAFAVAMMTLVLAPWAQFIPRASLASLLMLAAFRMVDRKQLAFHLRVTRLDAGVVLATALAAVAISVEFCVVSGVFLSFVLYVPRAAQVRMLQLALTPQQRIRERLAGDPVCDRLLIFSLEGDLFFGTEPELEKHFGVIKQEVEGIFIHERQKNGVLILALDRTRNPDAAFLSLLEAFHQSLQQRKITLLLAGVQLDLKMALTAIGLDARIGMKRIFCEPQWRSNGDASATLLRNQGASLWDAVEFAYSLLGGKRCAGCPKQYSGPAIATTAFRDIIRLKPDLAAAQGGLGLALTKQGKTDQALAAFREAIRLKPADPYYHCELGKVLLATGDVDRAIHACRESIRLSPSFAHAYNTLGQALVRQGLLQEAISAYRDAVRLMPDFTEAHNNLRLALMQ
jgi:SulP family sulfate permease